MPIYHNIKTIFIGIPKTGCTSIVDTLGRDVPFCFDLKKITNDNGQQTNRRLSHATAGEIERYFPEEWANYEKFTCIRNPYDRLWSAYWSAQKVYRLYGQSGHANRIVLNEKEGFETVVARLYERGIQSFSQRRSGEDDFIHFLPMVDFLTTKNQIHPPIKIYRFEKFSELAKDYNIKVHSNQNPVKPTSYRDGYNANTKRMAAKLYEEDLDCFKYTF